MSNDIELEDGFRYIELISKYPIKNYNVRYIKKIEPIILESLANEGLTINGYSEQRECKLNNILHRTILKRAVELALASRGININKQQ